jgi:hypothetical protein
MLRRFEIMRRKLRAFRDGAAFAVLAVGLVAISPANAALGGSYSTVGADRAHLSARLDTANSADYAVHTLTQINGITREYENRSGEIFAVTWQGPARPDLRQLLGDYFSAFQSDNALKGGRRARRPLSVNRSDVVIRTAGHPGAFSGIAYLPQITPADFSLDTLP